MFFLMLISLQFIASSLCAEGLCEVTALCWQTGSFYIVWCFISLVTVCSLAVLTVKVWALFPGRWCPLCTDSILNTHSLMQKALAAARLGEPQLLIIHLIWW